MLPIKADDVKLMLVVERNFRCGKKRIIQTPQLFLPQVIYPVHDHRSNVVAHWKKCGDERFGKFSLNLAAS